LNFFTGSGRFRGIFDLAQSDFDENPHQKAWSWPAERLMGYYPLLLEMNCRRCVVVGGGAVAERKVEGLIAAGADITVISPAVSEGLWKLLTTGTIRHVAREYRPGDLGGFEVVFVATDDAAVNSAVYRDARAQGIWVNCADDPDHCDFILPAAIRRGDLTVAVSTGGASPAATRAVREELDGYFTEDYAQFVQVAAEVRAELKRKSFSVAASAWNEALNGEFRRLIRAGKPEQAKEFLLMALGAGL
jgi:siroheme synthase-like protein